MKISIFENIYFVGIGGIGMSAIARYFKAIGKNVAGYDKTQTVLTSKLASEEIELVFDSSVESIPKAFLNKQNTLIVYTPAIPEGHEQLVYFQQNSFEIYKRSQILGLLSDDLKGIGVAGTHGKTTVSTITAHLFTQSNLGCSAFLGGIARNYSSNLILGVDSEWVVLEADEFDRSFLHLNPHTAVLTSMDADHLDIYGEKEELDKTFQLYVDKIKEGGNLVYKKGLNISTSNINAYTYDVDNIADFYATNLNLENGFYCFDLVYPHGCYKSLKLSYPGKINVENAVAASAVAILSGIEENELRNGLATFEGVHRRFDYHIRTEKTVYIDDYAHHPKELEVTISSVKELYPSKKITGVFQPHLFSRTRDFLDEFIESLNLLDEIILLDIYPARELPIEGICSELILAGLTKPAKLVDKSDLLSLISECKPEVLLTLGAGDIDKFVQPIKKILEEDEK